MAEKKYGGHKYQETGTSDCEHGCGCWAGDFRSGGPLGLDPSGTCPKNPEDGKLLGGNQDYEYVVEERIRNLQSRANKAEGELEKVSPDKIELAKKLDVMEAELRQKTVLLESIGALVKESEV